MSLSGGTMIASEILRRCLLLLNSYSITEEGQNEGPWVEKFQKAVDGKAQKEPYCMALVQWVFKGGALELFDSLVETGDMVEEYRPAFSGWLQNCDRNLFDSEHCMTVWNKTPSELKFTGPARGRIVIWNKRGTSSGHTGIITEVHSPAFFSCLEGNTGPGSNVEREGQGVYIKTRRNQTVGNMRLVGFIQPWR